MGATVYDSTPMIVYGDDSNLPFAAGLVMVAFLLAVIVLLYETLPSHTFELVHCEFLCVCVCVCVCLLSLGVKAWLQQ